ncbi:uracil-DNA glycosylase [Georgenia sp. H159]|uniref:uracil-DNA glycosylase n=1 Tax=Georgenia sp. H159 TaxID=3076115 RepID=UPI002D76E992|nr:uracil-DNA glycosylase [Georgenia sp. H159]
MSHVLPGSGWPGDRATPQTPVARSAAGARRLAAGSRDLPTLDARSTVCRACPRLVAWREHVADVKRRAFADETYWGRPAAGFGDDRGHLLVVGLAPAAHGANRTGRLFTGDRSGDWIFAALHRAGYANQATSVSADDGLELTGARMVPAVRCAPPDNAPTPAERAACSGWLEREIELLEPTTTAVLALGGIAWRATLSSLVALGWQVPRPRPAFGHGAEAPVITPSGREVRLIGSYHVSQQNTFTGRLTQEMLDDVLARCRATATGPPS